MKRKDGEEEKKKRNWVPFDRYEILFLAIGGGTGGKNSLSFFLFEQKEKEEASLSPSWLVKKDPLSPFDRRPIRGRREGGRRRQNVATHRKIGKLNFSGRKLLSSRGPPNLTPRPKLREKTNNSLVSS